MEFHQKIKMRLKCKINAIYESSSAHHATKMAICQSTTALVLDVPLETETTVWSPPVYHKKNMTSSTLCPHPEQWRA